MNLLARFVGQAEAEIGGATRRLIDSVADPVRVKGQVMAAELSAVVSRLVRLVVIKGAFGLLAAAMAIVAVVYLAAALHQALLPVFGPVETRVIMAGVFLVVAALSGIAMAFWPVGAPVQPPDIAADARRAIGRADEATAKAAEAEADKVRVAAEQLRTAADQAAASERPAAAAATDSLRSGVESLAGLLGAAGFRREQAGLRAGLMLANQLKPMQLVSLALIGGFLAGMRSRRR